VIESRYLGRTQPRVTGGRTLPSRATGTATGELATRRDELAAEVRAGFAGMAAATVGLEEELIVVEPGSLEPVFDVDSVLGPARDRRIAHEFRSAQLELVIPPAQTAGRLCRVLGNARLGLIDALRGDARILAAGGHPRARTPIRITDLPRYREIALDHPWATRRGLPTGLHVHVAAGEPDTALAVYNACRGYLPELAALTANSPFFEGTDSGLASSRLKLTEDFPRSGIPPLFESWETFAAFVSWGTTGGLFPDLTHCWWDLRLRPEYGTLEFRVADSQTSLDETAAVVALCQSLVAALSARHEAGEELPAYPTHMINENRWRALRGGLDGELVDYASGAAQPVRERLTRLLLELEPQATAIGCADELSHAWPMIAQNGAARQRAIAAKHGLDFLVESLVAQTEDQPGSLRPTSARTRHAQSAREHSVRASEPAAQRSAGDVAEIGRMP
jgi:glutamate---cysteine ligase / carboxylate-amine ligase